MPAYGNGFITQGYIYPEGFLDQQPGVDADGNPTRPDLVLGEWTCRGFFIGDGAYTESGVIVVSTQLFDCYAEPGWDPAVDKSPGNRTLVTEGVERIDVNLAFKRAVTGGTGPYAGARGEAVQQFLGFGDPVTMNVMQRHRIRIRP